MSGWTKMIDQVPENGVDVLVSASGCVFVAQYNHNHHYLWQAPSGLGIESSDFVLYAEPTHWMPLPEGPKDS